MYDVMAGKRGIKWHRHLKREKVLEMAPQLVQTGLKEGFSYFDGQTHDARLTFTLIRTAAQYGAAVTNYTEVTSFTKDADRVNGAIVKDRVSGQEITVRARHVVNATGIYAEQIEGLSGYEPQASVEPSKGVHLILSKEDVKIGNAALVLPETEDKRILFIVPWGSRVILGTTDTGTGDLDHPRATKEDITYLLSYINRYLGLHLTEKDIISTYAGYRPLVKPRSSNSSTAKLSRSHSVLEGASGIVTIVGGKLTTYRRMAQDTVDVLSRRDATKPVHATESLPLHGSAGWGRVQLELARRGSELGLTTEITEHLGQRYGAEAQTILAMVTEDSSLGTQLIADLPYIKAEIVYAYRNEMALTPEDVLARRTSITLEDRQRGLGILEEVAALMANDLHWSTTQQQQLIAEYRDNIQQQIAVEQGQEPTVMTQVSNGGTR
jgi:glycerol-3-phosphate dehydrogenase